MFNASVDASPFARWLRRAAAAAALVAPSIAGCAEDAGPWRFAIARSGCTQEDIGATEIVLTAREWDGQDPSPPAFIRIEAVGVRTGAARPIPLVGLRRKADQRQFARAALYQGVGRVEWLTGSLSVAQQEPSRAVTGSYSFCRSNGECFSGSFSAPWQQRRWRCG